MYHAVLLQRLSVIILSYLTRLKESFYFCGSWEIVLAQKVRACDTRYFKKRRTGLYYDKPPGILHSIQMATGYHVDKNLFQII